MASEPDGERQHEQDILGRIAERMNRGAGENGKAQSRAPLIAILTTVVTMLLGLFFTVTFSQHNAITAQQVGVDVKLATMMATDVEMRGTIAALQFRIETLERGREENRRSIQSLQETVTTNTAIIRGWKQR